MRRLILSALLAMTSTLPAFTQAGQSAEPAVVCFAYTQDPHGNAVSLRQVAPPAFKLTEDQLAQLPHDGGMLLTYRSSTPGAAMAKGPRVIVLLSTSPPLDQSALTYLPVDATVLLVQGAQSFTAVFPKEYAQSEQKLELLPKSSTQGTSASQRAKPEILEIGHADGRKTQLNCGPTPNDPH